MAMSKDDFVHLHNHTHYSMLDGHQTLKDMVGEAARLGQTAIASTDHGNLHSLYELQKAADEAGVQPIFGIEAYMAPTNGADRRTQERVFYGKSLDHDDAVESGSDVSGGGTYTHMTLLARNDEGLRNLYRFNLDSWTEGYYRKNRGDLESLATYGKGLIATTGCPSGEVQTRLRLGQWDEALEYAAQVRDIVGKENYFVELMNHEMTIDLETKMIPHLMEFAKKLGAPSIITNDAHYARHEDHKAHEYMLAMQTQATMLDAPMNEGGKRFAFSGEGYYIKSRAEMERVFRGMEFKQALDNTLLVAEMCQGVKIAYNDSLRPEIDIPEGMTAQEYLTQEVNRGIIERYGSITPELADRRDVELSVIIPKNYTHYFLVTADFVQWAKSNGVYVGPGRGSAGGSLIAFVLGITELDPIRHGLLFERFLNPERDSPPDIDMDFDDKNRERVIEYVTNKYGKDNVANIVTFTKMGVKTGIKDAARILNEPYATGDILSKKIPPAEAGKEMKFKQLFDPSEERYVEAEDFRTAVKDLNAEEIIKVARSVEGRVKTTGVHAAGVIISAKKIADYVPLMMRQADRAIITQFDYPTCESLGLIKMDFLGLRNLTIIRDAIASIKEQRGIDVDMNEIFHGPMDDPAVYEMLSEGHSLGVFQLDGGSMRELLRKMAPNSLDDISAVLALYRPGPMGMNSHNLYADRKNNRAQIEHIHPELIEPLASILDPTYGLCVFQEQVMQIAQKVASYSLAQADNLRRAMGKKKKEVLDAEFVPFSAGMKSNGYSDDAITALWNVLVPFAEYGFNKSHSVGYALLSYVTAYLKVTYPAEYMSALLQSVKDDKEKTSVYLQECKRMGIEVRTPDINLARAATSPADAKTIVLGFTLVGMSEERAQMIIDARGDKPFESINDFVNRVPAEILNKSLLNNLTYAGAFDSFGHSRRGLVAVLPDVATTGRATKREEAAGQFSLFSILDADDDTLEKLEVKVPLVPEFPKKELLAHERTVLGLYISDHPLSQLQHVLESESDTFIAEILSRTAKVIEGFPDADTPRQTIAGVVTGIETKRTKKGDEFAILTIEDRTGIIQANLFSRSWQKFKDQIKKDSVYVFVGVGKSREAEDTPTFGIDSLREIEMSDDGRVPFIVHLHPSQITAASMKALHDTLREQPGDSPVYLKISTNENDRQLVRIPEEYSVMPSRHLKDLMRWLFGQNACL